MDNENKNPAREASKWLNFHSACKYKYEPLALLSIKVTLNCFWFFFFLFQSFSFFIFTEVRGYSKVNRGGERERQRMEKVGKRTPKGSWMRSSWSSCGYNYLSPYQTFIILAILRGEEADTLQWFSGFPRLSYMYNIYIGEACATANFCNEFLNVINDLGKSTKSRHSTDQGRMGERKKLLRDPTVRCNDKNRWIKI